MPVEIVGQQLRIQIFPPKYDGYEYRTLDVGEPGKLQFIRMLDTKTGEWLTQSIRLNMADYDTWEEVERDLNLVKRYVDEKTFKETYDTAKAFWELIQEVRK